MIKISQSLSQFFRDTSLRSVGSIISSILAIAFLPYLGSLVGPEILGKQQLILSMGLFLSIMIGLKIDVIIPLQKNTNDRINLFKSSFILCTISVVLFFLLYLLISAFFQFPYTEQIIFASISCGFFLCLSLSSQQFLNTQSKFFTSGISDTVQRLTFIIFSIVCIFIFQSNELVIYALIVGILAKLIFNLFFIEKKHLNYLLNFNFEKPLLQLKNNLKPSAGWSSSQLIMTLGGLVPVIIIEKLYGFEQLGFYYLATNILFGPNSLLIRSFGDVFIQRLGDRKNSLMELKKTWIYSTSLILILALLFVLFINLVPNEYYSNFLSNNDYSWSSFGPTLKSLSILVLFSAITVPFDRVPIAFGWNFYPPAWNALRTISFILLGIMSMYYYFSFDLFIFYQVCIGSTFYIIDFFVVGYLLSFKKRVEG